MIKKDYRERYKKITQSDSFKSSYCNKSLGKEESGCESNFTAKSEDLEEEIKNYFSNWLTDLDNHKEFLLQFARHFTEWQKQKDQETIELAEEHAMLAGMNKMKEEMMKDAQDAVVVVGSDGKLYAVPIIIRLDEEIRNKKKVKIIIVNEE